MHACVRSMCEIHKMANNHCYFYHITNKLESIKLLILVILLVDHQQLGAIGSGGRKDNNTSGHGQLEKWNLIRSYGRRMMMTIGSAADVNRGGGGLSPRLDPKLREAEMNKMEIRVSQDGKGDFKTIQKAIDSIPPHNARRVLIYIQPGLYREKVHISKKLPFVTLIAGNSSDPPKITGNDTASDMGRDGRPLRTFHSATVAIDADYFVAVNILFENTAKADVGRSVNGEQGVALRITGTKAAFFNCGFYGSQDTLYDHKGLHYFKNCFIQGAVDFIFGYGRSLYQNCHLKSVAQNGVAASLTAQKRTAKSFASGFSFTNCTVTGTGSVYLGRAWGDYSRVIFSFSYLDALVLPQGWSDWGQPLRDSKVYYGEYKCSGPGANTTRRVPWARTLTKQEALPFIGPYFIHAHSWLLQPPT
ncbi:unnamed protein product [Cuscuta epithymum]|uniref:Pectinesterase n=1 Tax=Cuscuta epithymum TaxID=186058 RepID=A0AAV0CPI6_9ASTE|nr:unnamed protein product [Cuscuta epithymum]